MFAKEIQEKVMKWLVPQRTILSELDPEKRVDATPERSLPSLDTEKSGGFLPHANANFAK